MSVWDDRVLFCLVGKGISMYDFESVLEKLSHHLETHIDTCYDDDGAMVSDDFEAIWTNPIDDMLEISKMFPDAAFLLTQYANYDEDAMDVYFANGTYEICVPVTPPPKNIDWEGWPAYNEKQDDNKAEMNLNLDDIMDSIS